MDGSFRAAGEDIWMAVLELASEDIWVAVLGLVGEDMWWMRIFGWQFLEWRVRTFRKQF